MTSKTCFECKEAKSLDQFRKWAQSKDGLTTYCKACLSARERVYREKNKAKLKSYKFQYHYGISSEQYADLLQSQGGVCVICKQNKDGKFHVDHDHTTGAVRGILCPQCNVGIGYFYDNPSLLGEAIKYLSKCPSDLNSRSI